jgi:hypothetical protein
LTPWPIPTDQRLAAVRAALAGHADAGVVRLSAAVWIITAIQP